MSTEHPTPEQEAISRLQSVFDGTHPTAQWSRAHAAELFQRYESQSRRIAELTEELASFNSYATDALDWNRIRSGNYRALNPENQPIFDKYFGASPPPRKQQNCQSGSADICARTDGVTCPEDSCDIDDGIYPKPSPPPIQTQCTTHATEYRIQAGIPCPWCVIDELKRNRDKPPAAPTTPKDEWFRVEVSDHRGQIVAIEPEMLAGREIDGDSEATIRTAISHLSGFVGREGATYDFEPVVETPGGQS